MKQKDKNFSPFEQGSDVATAEKRPVKATKKETFVFNPEDYKKQSLKQLDRRFWGIFLATFFLNVILMLYLSNLPYEISEDVARRIQEHYANFIYQQQKTSPPVQSNLAETKGPGAEKKAAEEKPAETDKTAGAKSGKSAANKGPRTARERVAAKSRSTAQISQEVSKKGLLALITGTGEAAQGEAVQDVLGDDAGNAGGKNLDKILSNIGGIKTSGASEGVGKGGGSVRGGRTTGSGASIDDIVTGLGSAKQNTIKKKTKMRLFKSGRVKAEAGKSGGRSPEAVLAVVNSHKAAIEYCYQRALRSNPNLKGKISVRFVIRPDGSVGNVRVVESTMNNASVERCIVSKIRRWRDFGPVDPSKGNAVFRQDYIFGY
jgi:hypothetical protein